MNLAYLLGEDVSRTCMIFAMCCWVGVGVGFMMGSVGCVPLLSYNGIIHSPVLVHFLPHSIVRPLYLIVHPILLNVTSTDPTATFSWSGPSFTSNSSNPSISNATQAQSGDYIVTIILSGCSPFTDTVNVLVNPIFSQNFS